MTHDRQYLTLVGHILSNGERRRDRTGTGTISVFGPQLRFDLSKGFPAITAKRLFVKGVWVELLWMLSGEQNATFMLDNNVHIWDEWMEPDGDLGRVYGVQWRQWRTMPNEPDAKYRYIDQLQYAIDEIRNNPTSRRLLVNAWNPGELDEMALPPCHYAYQFYVHEDGRLDLLVNQRSADVFLGLPFDIASYATLLHMVAYVTQKIPGELIYNIGDAHIYMNHISQCEEMLGRAPFASPRLSVNVLSRRIVDIDDFLLQDLRLIGYNCHPAIKGDVSV